MFDSPDDYADIPFDGWPIWNVEQGAGPRGRQPIIQAQPGAQECEPPSRGKGALTGRHTWSSHLPIEHEPFMMVQGLPDEFFLSKAELGLR